MKLSMVVALTAAMLFACGGGQEIPKEKMARIMVNILKDNRVPVNDSTDFSSMKDEVFDPYTTPEGFKAADFKFTSKLYDQDKKKRDEFGQVFSKLMMEELLKAMNDSTLTQQPVK